MNIKIKHSPAKNLSSLYKYRTAMISIGIKNFIKSPPTWLKGQRIGLLCNQASVDENFVHSRDLIQEHFPGQLSCLFSPQHGFFAEKQDNMVESDHDSDKGLPVFSLYGNSRKPNDAMLDMFDVLLVDLPDVGTRVYTFMSTLAYCLEEAGRRHKRVVVLDRPNPVGGELVEGNVLQDDCRSFVGLFPMPMRHGLTFGELALFINDRLPEAAELLVVAMEGWERQYFSRIPGCPGFIPLLTCQLFTAPWFIRVRSSGKVPMSPKEGVPQCLLNYVGRHLLSTISYETILFMINCLAVYYGRYALNRWLINGLMRSASVYTCM